MKNDTLTFTGNLSGETSPGDRDLGSVMLTTDNWQGWISKVKSIDIGCKGDDYEVTITRDYAEELGLI